MQTIKFHPKVHLFTSEGADGNIDARFSPKKDLKVTREKLFTQMKLASNQIIEGQQIHSPRILALNSENSKMWRGNNVTGVDGFVTNQRDIAVMLRVADCVPVVIYDPDHHAVAVLHAGWRGTVAGIHLKAVEELTKRYQTNPKHVLVWLGPAACGKCFVSPESPEQVADPTWKPYIKKSKAGWQVDLPGYITASLQQLSVGKRAIKASTVCTVESAAYFSHARAEKTHEPEGRFAVVVKLG